jgi:hypothetical protein
MTQRQNQLVGLAAAAVLLVAVIWMIGSMIGRGAGQTRVEQVVLEAPSNASAGGSQSHKPGGPTPPRRPTSRPWNHGGLFAEVPTTLPADEIACPMVLGLSILKDKPDSNMTEELVGRTWETFGLMKFDLSPLSVPPKRAILKACVYAIENTKGFETPAIILFYRMRTDWDETATFRYASVKKDIQWYRGRFQANDPVNAAITPEATIVVSNPPPPGFNIEADITPLVADWVKGRQANYGILMRVDFAPGYSYQANLAVANHTRYYLPKIVVTP